MIEYLNIVINNKESHSYFVSIYKNHEDGLFHIEEGRGRNGVFSCPVSLEIESKGEYGPSKVRYKKTEYMDILWEIIENPIKSLLKGPRRYPQDFVIKKYVMGMSVNSFAIDICMENRVRTNHIHGEYSMLPDAVIEIIDVFYALNVIEWNLDE